MLLLAADISYVFCSRDFCIPILKILLDIKKVLNEQKLFILNETLVKIILASGTPIKVTFFLGLKKPFHFRFKVIFYFKTNLKGEINFPNIWKVLKENSMDKIIFQLVLEFVNPIMFVIVLLLCVLLHIVVLLL